MHIYSVSFFVVFVLKLPGQNIDALPGPKSPQLSLHRKTLIVFSILTHRDLMKLSEGFLNFFPLLQVKTKVVQDPWVSFGFSFI